MKAINVLFSHFVLLLLLIGQNAYSQAWEWGQQFSGNGNVKPVDIATDASDNIYVVGTYDTEDLTVGTDVLTYIGSTDVFVSSFTSTGVYRWSVQINGTGTNDVKGLDIDENGDIYVVGGFKDAAVYFTATDSLENFNHYDSYLAKYNSSGVLQYARRVFWGTNQERIQDVVVDKARSLIAVTGVFKAELIYFDGTIDQTITAVGPKDQFVATFNYAGEIQDIVSYNTTAKETSLKDISVCDAGGYFIGGDLRGRINFSGTEFIEGDAVNMDAMVFRVDGSLGYMWSRLGRGVGYDHVNSMASDRYSNVYITGKTESNPVTFDSTATLVGNAIGGYGGSDIYLAKYNRDGILQWARRKGDAGDDDAYGLAVSNNTIQFAGNYAGQIIINQDTLDSGSLTNVNTGFAIFDTDGGEIGGQEIAGDLEDRGQGVAFNTNGTTIITGYFSSSSIIADGHTLTNTNSPAYDGFLFEYNYPFSPAFTKVKNITCSGGSDGELIVTPYFGVPPYTYFWNHDTGLSDSIAINLSVGFYSVTVTDGNNESVILTQSLGEAEGIMVTGTISNTLCNNGNDGAIDIIVTGGTVSENYVYLWSSPDGSGLTPDLKNQVGLSAGNYNILVTDDNGCSGNASFVVSEPPPFSFAGSVVTNIDSQNGGSIDLNVSGGTPGYQYLWSGPNDYSSNVEDIDSLFNGGSYQVQVTDTNLCKADTSFNVLSSELMAYIVSKKDVSCYGGSDGEATVGATGVRWKLTYKWCDEEGNIIGTEATVTGLKAGSYKVRIHDNPEKCYAYANVVIFEPDAPLSSVINPFNLLCNGDYSGVADLTVTGGTPPYSYQWTNGETSEDITNLGSGMYAVDIMDANGCSIKDSTIITEPSPIVLNINTEKEILCNGDLGAIVTVEATGGSGDFLFLWDDPASQSTATATDLGAGNYSVAVTDTNGCEAVGEIEVTQPPEIFVQETKVNNINCYGASNGSISVSADGGSGDLLYTLTPGSEENSTGVFENLAADTYVVSITDTNSCGPVIVNNLVISEPEEIAIYAIKHVNITCNGANDGYIAVSAFGGESPLNYTLNPGSETNTTGVFNNLSANTYTVSITDTKQCGPVVTDEIIISEPEEISIFSETKSDITCFGANNGFVSVGAEGGIGSLSFMLSPGSEKNETGFFPDLSAGTYMISVSDESNCADVASSELTILEPPEIVIDSVSFSDESSSGAADGTISVYAHGGTGQLTYILKPDSIVNTTGLFTNLKKSSFSVEVTDEQNCGPVTTDEIYIGSVSVDDLLQDDHLKIYPNPTDGQIHFLLRNSNLENLKIEISNMGGKVLYKTDIQTSKLGIISKTLDLSSYPKGIYFIKIYSSKGLRIEKIIIE